MEKRLSNVFKTENVTKLSKTFLKSLYIALQESPSLIACMGFELKYLSGYILLTDQISSCLVAFISWDNGQYVYCTCSLTRLWRLLNFEINFLFLIKPFFLRDQKVNIKNSNILKTKRAFKLK